MDRKIALLILLLPGFAGMAQLLSYSHQPGEVGSSIPETFPADLQIGTEEQAKVVLFYHPKCPCTQATVRCLERLAASFASQPRIIAYAYVPSKEAESWVESATTGKLRTLGNVTVIADRDAEVCRRFDVSTSGHVLVYNKNGELKFSGGITPSRGHEGDCASGTAFLATVNGNSDAKESCPVYGCAIVQSNEAG